MRLMNPVDTPVEKAYTEGERVTLSGANYHRIPLVRSCAPGIIHVQRFLNVVKNLPEEAWVHVHCARGGSRTTTFAVFWDILKNAHRVSLADIIHRHGVLGGKNLGEIPPVTYDRYEGAMNRFYMVDAFYHYVKSKAHKRQSFLEWIEQNPAYKQRLCSNDRFLRYQEKK
jgi:hypothetical protein